MHRLRDGPRQDPFLEVSRVSVGRALSGQTVQAWPEEGCPGDERQPVMSSSASSSSGGRPSSRSLYGVTPSPRSFDPSDAALPGADQGPSCYCCNPGSVMQRGGEPHDVEQAIQPLHDGRTARLSLRRPDVADVAELFLMYSDRRVWQDDPLLRHSSIAQTESWVERWAAGWHRHGLGPWVLRTLPGRLRAPWSGWAAAVCRRRRRGTWPSASGPRCGGRGTPRRSRQRAGDALEHCDRIYRSRRWWPQATRGHGGPSSGQGSAAPGAARTTRTPTRRQNCCCTPIALCLRSRCASSPSRPRPRPRRIETAPMLNAKRHTTAARAVPQEDPL